jgi:hypothetical protein
MANLVTRDSVAYTCPACREEVVGHFKYMFTTDNGGGTGPASVIEGKLEIVGAVVDQHNCVPPVKR